MEPGSVGTSLHFDGQHLQSLQEAEYRKEEEQQQCELRQMLTNAFDLMDEDILSETSEECESHDGSSYKPDTSFNHGGAGDHQLNDQDVRSQNGVLDFHQTPHDNGAFQRSQNQKFVHNNNNQPFQGNPDLQRQSQDSDDINPRASYDFQRINQGINEFQTTENRDYRQNPSIENNYAPSSLGYASLQTNVNNIPVNSNQHLQNVPVSSTDVNYPSTDYYTRHNQGNYYFSTTPEGQPPTSMGNGYFTENRYTLEARSSLDISYPNPTTLALDTPTLTEQNDFIRSSQDFNQGYQYQPYSNNHEILSRNSREDLQSRVQHQDNQDNFQSYTPLHSHEQTEFPNRQNQFIGYDANGVPSNPNQHFDIPKQNHPFSTNNETVRPFKHYSSTSNLNQNSEIPQTNFTEIPSHNGHQFVHKDDSIPNHKRDIPEPHSMDSNTDEILQLKILNKARARELEELSVKYENLKQESCRDSRILKHQMTLMEEERDRLKSLNCKLEDSTQNLTDDNASLNMEVQRLGGEVNKLKDIKEDLMKKLSSAEASIENLNMQLIEAQLSDTNNRNRQQHEMMINGLQQKFEQEQQCMTEKLEKAYQIIHEKEEAIDCLNKELQEERIKASLLERNETLRSNGNDRTEEICKSLQVEVQELKDQIRSSKSASRLGAYSKSTQMLDHTHDDSIVDLGIRKTLHFNSTPNISHIELHTSERLTELQTELENIQITSKKKQELIDRLQRDLMNANSHVDILRKTLASNEKSRKDEEDLERRLEEMVDNEEKLTEINNELNHKLASLEESSKDLVEKKELEDTLKELDNVKQMYIVECEERSKQEKKLQEEYEEKIRQATEAFTATQSELSQEIENLQKSIAENKETIKELELRNLTKKYSKDNLDSSFIDNLNRKTQDTSQQTSPLIPNNLRDACAFTTSKEIPSDDSKDSSSLQSISLLIKNQSHIATDSFEISDHNDSMRSNRSRQSSRTGKIMDDIKKQHRSEIDYVRQTLIEENKSVSISLHQKMMEMREEHKQYIKKLKHDFRCEKEAMIIDFEKKQKAYLNYTKPDVKMIVELGSQYLDAMKHIKGALVKHIQETNQRAAEKIKKELSQEKIAQMEKVYRSNNFDGTLQE
ncbi:hypothetical protein SNE40_021587 [Patella caerulea]|uniref:CEP152 CEP63 binding coiled coil domain-containing protein n=1 Tax=Patella caerulea TaxID=87958 RepID=A0AAN8IZ84_PATCE